MENKEPQENAEEKITEICRVLFLSLLELRRKRAKQWKSAVLNSCGMCLVVYVYAATSDGVTSNSSSNSVDDGSGGGRGDGSSQLELSNDSNRLKCLPAIRRTNVINLLCLTASALWSIHLIFIIMFDLFHMFVFLISFFIWHVSVALSCARVNCAFSLGRVWMQAAFFGLCITKGYAIWARFVVLMRWKCRFRHLEIRCTCLALHTTHGTLNAHSQNITIIVNRIIISVCSQKAKR